MFNYIKYISVVLALFIGGLSLGDAAGSKTVERKSGVIETAVTEVRLASDPGISRSHRSTLLDGHLFSGMLIDQDMSGIYVFTRFENGLKQGLESAYYPGGARAFERVWDGGKREGTYVSWWEDGKIKQKAAYRADLLEGSSAEWFRDGQQARSFTYAAGQEEGQQMMWYEDGSIRANYHVKDGRRYGSIGTKGCGEKE